MMSVYDQIMAEMESRLAFKCETYAPQYICSYAVHAFNLMNQKQEIYFAGKMLPNMRVHLLFISPSGFMKTFYQDNMAVDKYGIFHNTVISISSEQEMTSAGFTGTIATVDGLSQPKPGAAELNMDSIMVIDEFKGVTEALKNQMNGQMETQLLAALDHGNVFKRLAGGAVSYTTHLTLWTGVQPGSYDLSSGLGRRLAVMNFVPTKDDNLAIMEIMHKTRGMKPDHDAMRELRENIDMAVHSMKGIEKIEFDDSILKLYRELDMYSFETTYFDRMILGYYLMKYPIDKVIHVDTGDKELVEMLRRQKTWREDVYIGLDFIQIRKILVMHGKKCTRSVLAKECAMIGWNTKQVNEKLVDMQKCMMVSVRGTDVTLLE